MTARDNIIMDSRFYRLVNGVPMPCSRAEAVAQLMQGDHMLLRHKLRRTTITTSFSVVNLAEVDAPPLLFTTLIIPEEETWGCKMWRSGSMEEAKRRHHWAVDKVQRNEFLMAQDDFQIKE